MDADHSHLSLRYVDWARGVAVLLMLEAHTLDAWTRPSSRATPEFHALTVLGGFAAPLFLWLAGLSLVLSAERRLRDTGSRAQATEACLKRGAWIFILAFLFRLQAFLVSPGGWPVMLFRVDILNIMGPTLAAAGLLWGVCGGTRRAAAACAGAAVAIVLAAPLVPASRFVAELPLWIQWYARPFGDLTTFTLFPWAGFAFAGACCGALVSRVASSREEGRLLGGMALAGGGLLILGFYSAVRTGLSTGGADSPAFFAIRLGVVTLLVSGLFLLSRVAARRRPLDPLELIGRNSLFIYWIHVELVYGYASWAIHHRLPLWGTAVGFLVMVCLMYGATIVKGRATGSWRFSRLTPASGRRVAA